MIAIVNNIIHVDTTYHFENNLVVKFICEKSIWMQCEKSFFDQSKRENVTKEELLKVSTKESERSG